MNQQLALEILKTGRNCFLTGAAGTGKTFVLNQYIKWLRENNIPVAITASTGIAATHIGGQTIHSWSGLGIKDSLTEWDLDALTQKQALVKSVNTAKVLIIDEVSMLKASTLDLINIILKTLRQSGEPFGGMQVVLSGDFFQLPPVVKMGESLPDEYASVFAFDSFAWQEADFKILYLKEQFRQQDELIDILNAIRERELTDDLKDKILDRVGKEVKGEPVHLFTHNQDVDALNEKKLLNLSGKLYEFPMELIGNKAKAEYMARNLLAPQILKLKEGARVMFVKNDPQGRYVNGSLGTVSGFYFEKPEVTLDSGETVLVEAAEWKMENESGKRIAAAVQLPLRLAWGITVHKSQGISIDSASVNLSKTFVEGQGYVALSRVRSINGLFIEAINDLAFKVNDYIFEKDQTFQEDSERTFKIFSNYSEARKDELIDNFKASASSKKKDENLPTHLVSLTLLNKFNSLKQIAKERELKEETIVRHFEKALDEKIDFDISHLQDFENINLPELFRVFKDIGFSKLSPVHEKLKGKYSFLQLRLARALYRQQNV